MGLFGLVNDSVVDSENSLIFVDFSKVSFTIVGFDAGSGQSLHSEHSFAGNDDCNIFPVELYIIQ